MPHTIWTVGHSNRSLEDFLALLRSQAIALVADVRRFPGSRLHPQFNRERFAAALAEAQIDYQHFAGLGGRRSRSKGPSPNQAWRVTSFNAYADHMQSDEFQQALAALMEQAARRPTAMLCSEALPWRCHRRLIADALLARNWQVLDILSPTQTKPRTLTEFARIEGGQVIYPAPTLFD